MRIGDMKLVWMAGLPGRVELFDLAVDPGETTNLAEKHPEKVAELKERVLTLAKEMTPPLLLMEAIKLTFGAAPIAADPSSMLNQLGD
jgi:hypothetical protein